MLREELFLNCVILKAACQPDERCPGLAVLHNHADLCHILFEAIPYRDMTYVVRGMLPADALFENCDGCLKLDAMLLTNVLSQLIVGDMEDDVTERAAMVYLRCLLCFARIIFGRLFPSLDWCNVFLTSSVSIIRPSRTAMRCMSLSWTSNCNSWNFS